MSYRQSFTPTLFSFLGLFCFSPFVLSNNLSNTHISEDSADEQDSAAFFIGGNKADMEANSQAETNKLAQSVELEVYKVKESYSSRMVFESPAGICYGYRNINGVSYTNSTQHYLYPNNTSEYYGSVTGAILYQKYEPKDWRYVLVYAINNPQLSREIQRREGKLIQAKAIEHVKEGKTILSDVVCK